MVYLLYAWTAPLALWIMGTCWLAVDLHVASGRVMRWVDETGRARECQGMEGIWD